jgi:gamma-D-glutamyl-L-lysine dipeptidyl-peptidase
VRAGAPAYVAVSVATLWRSPTSVRPVDAPALANPARVREWLAALDAAAQAGLIDRADSQLLLDERVDVLAAGGGWAKVVVPDQATPVDARGYPGWIPVGQLTAVPPPLAADTATVVVPTAWLLSHGVDAFEVSFGTRLPVLSTAGSIVHVAVAGGATYDIGSSAVVVAATGRAALPNTASAVVASMRLFMNLRYLWAGTSGFGFDCSGLMYAVFKVHGVLLPRDAQDQAGAGVAVAQSAMQPGDLVFLASGGYVHHVAIYVGAGMLLDSPDLGRGVQLVSMAVAPYSTEYAGARRVV